MTTVSVQIPVQPGIKEPYEADFTAGGAMVVSNAPIGFKFPDQFIINYEGSEFFAISTGSDPDCRIHSDDAAAFTGEVYG